MRLRAINDRPYIFEEGSEYDSRKGNARTSGDYTNGKVGGVPGKAEAALPSPSPAATPPPRGEGVKLTER